MFFHRSKEWLHFDHFITLKGVKSFTLKIKQAHKPTHKKSTKWNDSWKLIQWKRSYSDMSQSCQWWFWLEHLTWDMLKTKWQRSCQVSLYLEIEHSCICGLLKENYGMEEASLPFPCPGASLTEEQVAVKVRRIG